MLRPHHCLSSCLSASLRRVLPHCPLFQTGLTLPITMWPGTWRGGRQVSFCHYLAPCAAWRVWRICTARLLHVTRRLWSDFLQATWTRSKSRPRLKRSAVHWTRECGHLPVYCLHSYQVRSRRRSPCSEDRSQWVTAPEKHHAGVAQGCASTKERNGRVPFGLSDKLTNRNARSPSLGLKPLK